MKYPVKRSVADDCVRIKGLGYSFPRHIKMYGEEFQIVSDPFPDGVRVAVKVTSSLEPGERTLHLLTSILVGIRDALPEI